jgi:DNA replication regulator SLD3
VNKRFGGPGAISPEKQRKPKPQKPSEQDLKAKTEKQKRRPLQKTPSESYNQSKARPPSLMRSATDSLTMPRLKREASEMSVSMFDIPPAKPATRGTSVQLKHLQARQIDINALTIATEKKLRQKAKIEEELKGAINTLKKPNRGLAIKEYVDNTEQRSLGSTSMRKKTAALNRKILHNVNNVQVTATPRHVRKTDALVPVTATKTRVDDHDEVAPSSGDICIPSSTVRPSSSGRIAFKQPVFISKANGAGNSVIDTPSRGRSKTVSFTSFDKPQLSSGLSDLQPTTNLRTDPAIVQTPSRPSTNSFHFASVHSQATSEDTILQTPSKPKRVEKKTAAIFATPQKPPRSIAAAVPQTPDPPKSMTASKTMTGPHTVDLDEGMDIYAALGWDDFDELA